MQLTASDDIVDSQAKGLPLYHSKVGMHIAESFSLGLREEFLYQGDIGFKFKFSLRGQFFLIGYGGDISEDASQED